MSSVSEYITVCYHFNGVKRSSPPEAAAAFATAVIACANKTTAVFTNIAIARSTAVVEPTSMNLNHALSLIHVEGPITPEAFYTIMRYPRSGSNLQWQEYIEKNVRIAVPASNDSKQPAPQDIAPPPYSES